MSAARLQQLSSKRNERFVDADNGLPAILNGCAATMRREIIAPRMHDWPEAPEDEDALH
jgi:hypothetical protein